MASRTLFSKTCFKSSLVKAAATKKNVLNNKTTIFPASQTSRQATTVVDNSATQGRLPAFQLFEHPNMNKKDIHLVNFTSVEGKRLFRNAMVQGHAESFFKLMGNFSTQSSPSHGGVSSRKYFITLLLYFTQILTEISSFSSCYGIECSRD
jgi:glutathione gamma-glutamylcysteinyltransferase